MINVSELMVNNWLKDERGTTFQVNSIEFLGKHTICSTSGLYHELSSCHPIPLTSEIALAVGFYEGYGKILSLDIKANYGCDIQFNQKDGSAELCDCDNGSIGKEFKYVHQLQNLYFALTGEELTLNL